MTPRILDLAQIAALGRPRPLVGGKALALARLAAAGFAVPEGFCLTAAAYREVIRHADLEAAIDRLLGSIDLAAARFEEIWDVSLAIRNIFLRADAATVAHRRACEPGRDPGRRTARRALLGPG